MPNNSPSYESRSIPNGGFVIPGPFRDHRMHRERGHLDALWFLPIVPVYLLILGPRIFPDLTAPTVSVVLLIGALIQAVLITLALLRYRRKRNHAIELLESVNASLAKYGYRLQRCDLKKLPNGEQQVRIKLTDLLDASIGRTFDVSCGSAWSFTPTM